MKTIKLVNIKIEEIYPRNNQPRKYFDDDAILELSKSIEKHGILQPIIVSKESRGYAIIAGERRYRAAKMSKLESLPCIVRQNTNTKEIAIIENIQRENLSPMEEASAINDYMKEYSISQSDMAQILSKSRSYIANRLRILSLDEYTASQLNNNKLSEGHAKTLLGIKDEKKRKELANKIIKEGLSVRATESYVRQSKKVIQKDKTSEDIYIKEAMDKLIDILGTKVYLGGNDKQGCLVIEYYNKDQLFDLVEKLYSLE